MGAFPIIGEVKLTTKNKQGKWTPDKDPFYALIQALASAAYVLPRNQFARLGLHDPTGLLDREHPRVALYLVIGKAPEAAGFWFDLRDYAERLSQAIIAGVADHVDVIAGLDRDWFDHRPSASRLQITKRFAHHAS